MHANWHDRPVRSQRQPLLQVRNLQTYFPIRRGVLSRTVGYVKAVDGVSFDIQPGKTLGLVGESGCGKTTVGRTILRLIPATAGQSSTRAKISSPTTAKSFASSAGTCRSSSRTRSAA